MSTTIESYIRAAATARGINPDVAVRVAKSEGGLNDPTRRAEYVKNGRREPSYGPYQLLIGGGNTGFPVGMGNDALAAGIDPRDPANWQKGVDFALDRAKSGGWTPWYGAKAAGINRWDGINGKVERAPLPDINPYAGMPDGPKGSESYAPAQQPSLMETAARKLGLGVSPEEAEQIRRENSTDEEPTFADRMRALGRGLESMEGPPAPRLSMGLGSTEGQAAALLNALKGRGSLAEYYQRQRRSGR